MYTKPHHVFHLYREHKRCDKLITTLEEHFILKAGCFLMYRCLGHSWGVEPSLLLPTHCGTVYLTFLYLYSIFYRESHCIFILEIFLIYISFNFILF